MRRHLVNWPKLAVVTLVAVLAGCGGGSTTTPTPQTAAPNGGNRKISVVQTQPPSPFVSFPFPSDASAETNTAMAVNGTNVWFTLEPTASGSTDGRIAEISMTGKETEYRLAGAAPASVVTGSDNNLWVADSNGAIWRVTTAGVSTRYPTPNLTYLPQAIASGPDHNLWFSYLTASPAGGGIGKITKTGTFAFYPLQNHCSVAPTPGAIVTGSDGKLWFADGAYIGTITTTGVIAEYQLNNTPSITALATIASTTYAGGSNGIIEPIAPGGIEGTALPENAPVTGIVGGVDGNIYVVSGSPASLGSFPPGGQGTAVTIPAVSGTIPAIVSGSDGNLWYSPTASAAVDVYILRQQTATPSAIAFTQLGQTQTFSVSESNYSGTFTVTSSNSKEASVVATSTPNTYTVTANAVGTLKLSIADTFGNTSTVNVTVTTETFVVQ